MSEAGLTDAGLEEGLEDETLIDEPEVDEDAEAELEARKQGWKPLGEYRGDPVKWVPAKEFLEKGERILPVVRKERDELRQTTARMAAQMTQLRDELASNTQKSAEEITQMRADLARLLDHYRKAEQRGRDLALEEHRAAQRAAVAAGDVAAFEDADRRIEAIRSEQPEPPPPPPPNPTPRPQVKLDPPVQAFVDENPWYLTDRVLNSAMLAEYASVEEESPGMDVSDRLAEAKRRVVARHPKKFGQPAAEPPPPPRRPAPPLAPTGRDSNPRQRKTGIDGIEDATQRQEARVGYQRALRSMPDLKEDEYLAVFLDPHADVLAVMDQNQTSKRGKTNAKR